MSKGVFKPKNAKKYKGDPTNIVYRSSWEFAFMRYCDSHPDILEWASEELAIPYRSPIDGRVHRYFPDFILKKKNKLGKIEVNMVEIKPYYQTIAPKRGKKQTERTFITEVKNWGINTSKWKAASAFCVARGWKFIILSERKSETYDSSNIQLDLTESG